MTDLDMLRTASADEARAFLTDVDPVALVGAIRSTGDDDLAALFGRAEVRGVAVSVLVNRLDEFAVLDRLHLVHGVVRFDVEQDGAVVESRAVAFTGGTVAEVPVESPADVAIRTGILCFVRLVSGERNAGLEYLAGTLAIDGDADLALAVGGMFRVPGSDGVAVDPTLLDPVDVATALKGVSARHLRTVMASGFRPVVLGEIFRRLPDFVDAERAGGDRLCVGFRLLGHPSGEIERYVVTIADGVASVAAGDEGDEGGERDATITCEGHDFLRLATGHLGAVGGVLRGQLKVRGDKAKALRLSSLIDFPQAR